MRLHQLVVAAMAIGQMVAAAPPSVAAVRAPKSLAFYDYADDPDYNSYLEENEYVEDNDLSSRSIPTRKGAASLNSPIYYIRLPPQPYMFVPGLGYVSQPPPSPMSQFVNLPMSFIANGKPTTIYQWNGGLQNFPTAPPPPPPLPIAHKPAPPKDSTIHRLPGQYNFNGKPDDIFVLRDSYNSLYGDVLQNFYP